jgi:hypothetical protein
VTFTGRNYRAATNKQWNLVKFCRDGDVFALDCTAVGMVREVVVIYLCRGYELQL